MADYTEEKEEMLEDEEYGVITLTLDDGTELECAIIAIYPVGDNQYIALLPMDDDGEISEEAEVLIYRFIDNGDDEPELENIDDDDEYEMAADAFEEILDAEEFDEGEE